VPGGVRVRHLTGGRIFQIEYRLRRPRWEYRWVLDMGVPLFRSDQSFAGYIGSCIDVTERKLADEALSNGKPQAH